MRTAVVCAKHAETGGPEARKSDLLLGIIVKRGCTRIVCYRFLSFPSRPPLNNPQARSRQQTRVRSYQQHSRFHSGVGHYEFLHDFSSRNSREGFVRITLPFCLVCLAGLLQASFSPSQVSGESHADRDWKLPSPARQAAPTLNFPPGQSPPHQARPLRHRPGRRSLKSQQARFCEVGNAFVVLPPAVEDRRRDPERQGTRCAAVASASAPGRRHRGISLFYSSPSHLWLRRLRPRLLPPCASHHSQTPQRGSRGS